MGEYVLMMSMNEAYDGDTEDRPLRTTIGLISVIIGTAAWAYYFRASLLALDGGTLLSMALLLFAVVVMVRQWTSYD